MIQTSKSFLSNSFVILALLGTFIVPSLDAAPQKKAKSGCEYRTFNIKTNNKATAGELLSELAEICDFSVVLKDAEAEKVLAKNLNGINIKDLSLEEIFNIVIEDNDLFYSYDKNFLRVSALSTKSFKVDYVTSVRTGTAVINASVDANPTEEGGTRNTTSQAQNMITSNDTFDFWKTISTELTSIMNTGAESYVTQAPIINPNAGMVTVTATKKQLDRVANYIEILKERLHRQVLIDVSIISVSLASTNKTGVDWSKFSLGFKSSTIFNNSNQGSLQHTVLPTDTSGVQNVFTSGVSGVTNLNNLTVINDGIFSITGLIDFLASNGETKVISSPKVLTMNNQQALITIGDNINYRVPEESTSTSSTTPGASLATTYTNYSIFIGVLLNITPEISETNEIILRINPSVSNFKYADDDARREDGDAREIAPDTSEKKLSTVVKVKDGSTIILGGLIANSKGKDNSKVPLLGDIPIIGEAFKHSADTISASELVFVITPRIIGDKGTDKATLQDLGFSQKIYE